MAAPFDFDYLTREPAPPLGEYVESIWYARGTVPYKRERIAPTGSTVAVFVLGDPIIETADDGRDESFRAERGFLIGPHDRPVINEPTGETFAVGVVCTPVGAGPALGVSPALLRGRVVDLEAVWTRAASIRSELEEAAAPEVMLDRLEADLRANLADGGTRIERCRVAVAMLEADPTTPIAGIASDLGVSHAHLDREFTSVVGLTPRALARLLRVRRLLAGIDAQGEIPWAGLAVDLGWYDQAHLIRDFKRHTGVTPTRYIEAQKAFTSSSSSDTPGFVPEPDM